MYPIPKNLQKIIIPKGTKNNEFQFYGQLTCSCGNNHFEVLYVGDDTYYAKERTIKVVEIGKKYFLIVKAQCKQCHKIHLLFDKDYHGWNGFVCEGFGSRIHPRPKSKKWNCINCSNSEHKVNINIFSKGQQDFIEETEGQLNKTDWVEGYSLIRIGIECVFCGLSNKGWTSCETM